MERRRLKVRYLGGVSFVGDQIGKAYNVFGYAVDSSVVDSIVKRFLRREKR
jgi:hypothetical protein